MLRRISKILPFTSLLIAILMATNIYLTYMDVQQINMNKTRSLQQLLDTEFDVFITSVLKENQSKALINATSIATRIKEDLIYNYSGDLATLKKEIDHLNKDSDFLKILNQHVDRKYLNVDSDNDDLFVALRKMIIYDKSINCSKNGESRTWNVEMSMHYNKTLANEAITRILNQDIASKDPIGWEFLTSDNPDHIKISTMSIPNLKKIFIKEGLEGLSTYEILTPVYIDGNGDIFGNPIIDNTGTKNDNYQLIVVQGFNLVDAIHIRHSNQLQYFNMTKQNIIDNYIQQQTNRIVVGVLFTIIVFIVLLSISTLQNMSIEYEEEKHKEE